MPEAASVKIGRLVVSGSVEFPEVAFAPDPTGYVTKVVWIEATGAVVGTGAVVMAGTPVGILVLAAGAEVGTAATSEVGYTSVASEAVTMRVTWGIVRVSVTEEVVTDTILPEEGPIVIVVGSHGTTVVMVLMTV